MEKSTHVKIVKKLEVFENMGMVYLESSSVHKKHTAELVSYLDDGSKRFGFILDGELKFTSSDIYPARLRYSNYIKDWVSTYL